MKDAIQSKGASMLEAKAGDRQSRLLGPCDSRSLGMGPGTPVQWRLQRQWSRRVSDAVCAQGTISPCWLRGTELKKN